ncbi:MAG: hypothetical protein KF914_15360 [Rhizobiaceae bacterium]|nr:hypothetical protein [Rhizobiaceae bacterium]
MIKTALVALTVVGCDCDARLCEFISETPPTWQSVAECEAAAAHQIATSRSLNYPLVTSICRQHPAATQAETVAQASSEPPQAKAAGGAAQERSPDIERGLYRTLADGSAVVYRRGAEGYVTLRSGFEAVAGRAVGLLRRSADTVLSARLVGN